MTTVIRKHIHSCFASMSSKDAVLYYETQAKLDFIPRKNSKIVSKKFNLVNGETVADISKDKDLLVIHLESDKTFYRGGLSTDYHNTPEFKTLVRLNIALGYSQIVPVSLKEFYKREELKTQEKEKKAGIVLWMNYDTFTKNPELYQGGFSDVVFNTDKLQSYVKSGVVYGWIGDSSSRKAWHDELIEAGLKERGLSPTRMESWISSSNGRHFADALCGCNKKQQTDMIKKELNSMFNCCLVYSAPEHGGMYTDTVKIKEHFGKLGLLLPTDKINFNKKQYIDNLSKVFKTLSGKKRLDKMETYVYEFVKDVFANLTSPLV